MPERDVLEPHHGCGAHEASEPADAFSDLRVALVRHRRGTLHSLAEGLFDLANLGTRKMTYLGRGTVERAGEEREHRKQLRVTVAGDHLRRERVGFELESLQAIRSTSGPSPAYVPTVPESWPTRLDSSARTRRARPRSSSKTQPASFQPKVVGSA